MNANPNPKIANLIKTSSGYSAQVDLNLWFPDSVKNLNTMRRYKPTVSHRQVFEQVARALDNKDKRVYLITGNYGTGKSHLCLMLANYFAYPSTQPEIAQFLDNYADEDPATAEKLRARRSKGRYLVALCDYDSTDDFGEVVLRAILDALQDEGLADELRTPYEEARRKLEQLEAEQQSGQALVDYYGLFTQQLPHYQAGVTMNAFKEKLYPDMDRAALDSFKRMHQDILRTPFTYEAGNLSAILKSTLASPAFLERFAGLVVFWDEFGYTLGDPNRLSLNVFQQFAQLCADFDPTRGKLIFVATAHRGFSAYAPAWASADYIKISDRVADINLFPEGLEDVIGAVVSPDKAHPVWKNTILPQASPVWSQWLKASKDSGIFEWLVNKPPVFRGKILEGVYPMHPMATYAVIELAQEIASQNRTIFTFFSSEHDDLFEDGSYLWYIHNHNIRTQDKLNFYTVDLLFDYFRTRLRTTNPDLSPGAKDKVSDYEAARIQLQRARNQHPMSLSDSSVIEPVLRVMLIYNLIGVHNSVENLAFGLNYQPNKQPVLESQLDELVRFGVVHCNPSTQLYEFRRSDLFDVDGSVEDYKREHGEKLGNLAVELNDLAPLSRKEQYLEAKAYNMQYAEDKRLERRIVTPGDLATESVLNGQTVDYFTRLEADVAREVNRAGAFEGIALYVICESTTDITTARDLAAKNASRRVVVAIPTTPIAFKDALLNLKAIRELAASPEADNFSTQDKGLVNERDREFGKKLLALRSKLLDSRHLTWLGAYGKALPVDANRPDDPATRVMQASYQRRNRFSHDDFNMIHDVRNFSKPHLSMVEAVNALLKSGAEISIDAKQADNRGEIRYLQRCLYQQGALASARQQGSVTYVEVERDLSRFEHALPALAAMVSDIQALKADQQLSLQSFLHTYRQPPYGLGNIALALFFAVVLRFFGDTIKIKKDSTAIGDLYVANFDLLADLIKGNYPNAFIQYREIQPGERALINGVYAVFSDATSAAQGSVTTTNAYDAVAAWYQDVPPVAQIEGLYQGEERAPALRFLNVLEKLNAQDAHTFILGELQTVAGYDRDEMITPARAQEVLAVLRTTREQIMAAQERVQSKIRDGLSAIFAVQGSTWDDVAEGVRAWYNALDANQRAPTMPWNNDASKPLVQLFVDLSSPRDLFLEHLPARPSYGFKRVRDWNADLTQDYLAKIRAGVAHITAHKIKVPSPQVALVGEDYRQQKDTVLFTGPLRLRLTHPDPDVRIFVTDTHNDPRHATQRDEFRGTQNYDIAARVRAQHSAVTIQYIPQDAEGNWGIVQKLTFIDETQENEIRKPKTLIKEGMKTPVTFVFPTNAAGVAAACRSFFESLLENEVVDRTRLREVVEKVLDEVAKLS